MNFGMAVAVLLMLIGEAMAIYSELRAVRAPFYIALPWGFLGQAFVVYGYVVGYRISKNIWPVSAASIGSILVVEPLMNLIVMRELPGRNALIGCALGALGAIIAMVKE